MYGDCVGGVPAGVCAPETGPDSHGLGCAGVAVPDDDREGGTMGGRFLPVGKKELKAGALSEHPFILQQKMWYLRGLGCCPRQVAGPLYAVVVADVELLRSPAGLPTLQERASMAGAPKDAFEPESAIHRI